MYAGVDRFRQKLDGGQTCFGAGITLADSSIVEALAPSVDFVWIDLEHSHLSYESVQSHLIAARAGGTCALVRVRGSDPSHIKPILDIGAHGIIVPQVSSAAEVQSVVDACRYPPLGTRGYGPRRPSNYGRTGGPQWMQDVNRQVFVAVQIENLAALRDLEAIAAIPGLDSLALGPYDLAVALGRPGEVTHPNVRAELQHIVQAARNAGKYIGTGMGAYADLAMNAVDLGVQWIQCGDDYGYMVAKVDELMSGLRAQLTKLQSG
jgi:2-keto-3-deoxy-L-rhamnonate aldolase RhmA